MKNAFDKLISRLDMTEEKISELKISQQKLHQLKCKEKKLQGENKPTTKHTI